MAEIQYVGPFDEVVIPALDVTVANGGTVECDDDLAAAFTDQTDWSTAEQKAAGKKAVATKAEGGAA